MAGVDINRTTAGVQLPPQLATEIWADAQEQSFVMQRVPKVDLPGEGKTFQTITGDGSAKFVAETGRKPVSNPTFGKKELRAHKIAIVNSFSDEFRRDKAALFNALRPRLAGDIGKTFDLAVLHGIDAPVNGFDNLSGVASSGLDSPAYDKFVAALQSVSASNGDVDAWALSGQGEAKVLLEKDTAGRPLFISSMANDGQAGQILGRPVWRNKHVYQAADADNAETLGFGGDWGSAMWGSVEGIKYEEYGGPVFNDDGTLVHAGRQDNMFSVICEIEIGFIARDLGRFFRFTGAAATGG